MQGAIIQSSVKIGKHCIINTGVSVDHDCVIQDYVHVAPRCTLCGNVEIGEGSLIGAGTVVMPNISIGKWSVICTDSYGICKNNLHRLTTVPLSFATLLKGQPRFMQQYYKISAGR
jgi:UDP-3-O-[3-hydroxymyristoyl] glucosamine N-acyltransferase